MRPADIAKGAITVSGMILVVGAVVSVVLFPAAIAYLGWTGAIEFELVVLLLLTITVYLSAL